MFRISTLFVLSLLSLGCLGELPDESELEWNRVLALRVLPQQPEPNLAPRATVAPGEPVRAEALLAGPEGVLDAQAVDALWFACPSEPGQPGFACFDDRLPLDVDALPSCPALGDPFDTACALGAGLPLDWTVPGDERLLQAQEFEVLLIAADPEGSRSAQTCAEAILGGTRNTPNDCLFASSKVRIAPLSPTGELPDELPEGFLNRHPTLPSFEVSTPDGEPQEVAAGEAVAIGRDAEIEALVQEGSVETYPVPVNDGDTFRDRDEELQVSWFRTAGSVEDSGGFGDAEGSERITWSRGEEGTVAHLVAVVRDGRGGVDWASVQVDPL